MSDIFISYSSEDKSRVQDLARALEQKGWSVWWDRRIPVGRSYADVIEEALDASKAVVVVWTSTSVKSQWVKNEALEGLNRRALFPVMLEAVKIPLEFRHVQAARLMDWQPEQEHAGFDQFIDDLTGVIRAHSNAVIQPPPVTQSQATPHAPHAPYAPSLPTIEAESPRKIARKVETEPECLNQQRFTTMSGVRLHESAVESGSSMAATETLENEQKFARASEDRSRVSTGVTSSTQPLPYLPIGIAVLVVGGGASGLWDLVIMVYTFGKGVPCEEG